MKSNVTRAASMSTGRAAALARRQAMSSRGKAGLNGGAMSQAQTARAANPNLSSRELARAVRAQRSHKGSAGQKKSEPCGRKRMRPNAEGSAGPGRRAKRLLESRCRRNGVWPDRDRHPGRAQCPHHRRRTR